MCSVAGALANTGRHAWCNDVQLYATTVARALVSSVAPPLTDSHVISYLFVSFQENMTALKDRFDVDLRVEASALAQDTYENFQQVGSDWRHAANDPDIANEVLSLRTTSKSFPYRLVSLTYSHGYFGLRQSLELDSLKYAIDQVMQKGMITPEEAHWCLVALLQTASRIATTSGHFAQYLTIKDQSTYDIIRPYRRRSVWSVFLTALDKILPYGTYRWRSGNRVFCQESISLIGDLAEEDVLPRIIYADPPYSEAQYSRFYHVLETLVKYDYPSVKGKGRYRDDRFLTPFSKPKAVRDAFISLAENSSQLGADLVISYPSNGLLFTVGGDLTSILREYYDSVNITKIDHQHSTLGGRPGRKHSDVEEMIFVARRFIHAEG
jgi:adenine-specific DNA-methyltransferase